MFASDPDIEVAGTTLIGSLRAIHEVEVALQVAYYRSLGYIVTLYVQFYHPGTSLTTVVDYVVSTLDFPIPQVGFAVDVKTGGAGLRPNQQVPYQILERGDVFIPRGLRALQAGFIPGIPTFLKVAVAVQWVCSWIQEV